MANVECIVENQILHANIAKNDVMSAKITFHECQILTMFSKFKFLISFTFDFNTPGFGIDGGTCPSIKNLMEGQNSRKNPKISSA